MTEKTHAQINTQIQIAAAKAAAQSKRRNNSATSTDELRKQVADCVSTVMQINNMFGMLNLTRVWFDEEYLKKEGNTDLDRLDRNYMITIGRQLVADSRLLSTESLTIVDDVNRMAKRAQNAIEARNPSAITNVAVDAVELQIQSADFAERLSTLCVNASNDIITHLNTLRAPEHQIKYI